MHECLYPTSFSLINRFRHSDRSGGIFPGDGGRSFDFAQDDAGKEDLHMSDKNQSDQLYAMRHSLAHIMASAIQHLWPEVKLGVGPVVENGFYYDVDLGGEQLSADDFERIEAEMQKIIGAAEPF